MIKFLFLNMALPSQPEFRTPSSSFPQPSR